MHRMQTCPWPDPSREEEEEEFKRALGATALPDGKGYLEPDQIAVDSCQDAGEHGAARVHGTPDRVATVPASRWTFHLALQYVEGADGYTDSLLLALQTCAEGAGCSLAVLDVSCPGTPDDSSSSSLDGSGHGHVCILCIAAVGACFLLLCSLVACLSFHLGKKTGARVVATDTEHPLEVVAVGVGDHLNTLAKRRGAVCVSPSKAAVYCVGPVVAEEQKPEPPLVPETPDTSDLPASGLLQHPNVN